MTQPPKPIISLVHPQAANLHKAISSSSLLDEKSNDEDEVSEAELNDLFGSNKTKRKRGPPARKDLKTSKKMKLDGSSSSVGKNNINNNNLKEEKPSTLRQSDKKIASKADSKKNTKTEDLLVISDSDSEDIPDLSQILEENSESKSSDNTKTIKNKIKVKPVYIDENTLRQDPGIASSFNALSALRAMKSRSQQLATSTADLMENNFDMTSNYSRGNDADPRDILLLIKSMIPDTEARGLLKVRYLRDDNFRKLMEVLSKVFSIDQYMIVVKFDGIGLNLNDTPRKYGMEDNDVLVASLMDQKPIKTSRELKQSGLKSSLASSSKTVVPSVELNNDFDDFDEDAFDLNGSMDESKMKAVEEQIEKEIEAKFGNATQNEDEVSVHEDKIMLKVVLPAGREPMQFRLAKDAPLSKIIAAVSKSLNVAENKVKLSFDGQVLNPMTTPEDHDMEDEDMLDAVIKK